MGAPAVVQARQLITVPAGRSNATTQATDTLWTIEEAVAPSGSLTYSEDLGACKCCMKGFAIADIGSSDTQTKVVKTPLSDRKFAYTKGHVRNDPTWTTAMTDTFTAQIDNKKEETTVTRTDVKTGWSQTPVLELCFGNRPAKSSA